jgi:hypothetical protein
MKQKAATRRNVTAECEVLPCFVGAGGALGIVDHLRRRFARFKLGGHCLDLRRLLVQTRSKLRF